MGSQLGDDTAPMFAAEGRYEASQPDDFARMVLREVVLGKPPGEPPPGEPPPGEPPPGEPPLGEPPPGEPPPGEPPPGKPPLGEPPPGEPPPGEPPPATSTGPMRLAMIWLTEGASGKGHRLDDEHPLTVGGSYSLHLQIQAREEQDQDDRTSQAESGEEEKKLSAVFFSPETDFELQLKTGTLTLPGRGPSDAIRRPFKPLRIGRYQIRACIYYGNVLLQSAVVEANVEQPGARAAATNAGEGEPAIARLMDYIASTDLTALDELPQPDLSIFTNLAADGTHWIGVFASGDITSFGLRSGDVHTFDADELAAMAKVIRELLAKIEGSKKAYKFADPLPLDEQGKLRRDDEKLERREKNLVALAVRGCIMYDALFFSRADAAERWTQLLNFDKALQSPGIVSVARCRGQSTTFPWAALYARYLDTGKEDEIRLCGIFKAQLAANRWSDDMAELKKEQNHDLLDHPNTCRSKSECPLNVEDGDDKGLIVCPFGFWGFLHQVEQPLQYVKPIHVKILEELSDETSDESRHSKLNQILSRMRSQTSFLMCSRGGEVRIAIGAYPRIPDAKAHQAEIEALPRPPGSPPPDVTYEDDRDQMMTLLKEDGRHLYYFYCHGKVEGDVFKLKLGPKGRPRYISATDLDPRKIRWPDQPLVILNACETVAETPKQIHGFMGKLRLLGASGTVGSEIKVWTQLARPFGFQLVKQILAGQSVGEAFLGIRRHLLRQYNPLGLVYSYYAPATLHLHDPPDCTWCQTHPPKRVPVGSG